ncbi:MAG: hypothetical protein NWT08_11540 [Akkermansiaceae bacterium]|jgi:hypothetical protein|nr:hypothetical protein [Akkermansiaceae bacterium]MDP4719794.1 hypothetical protein [Akkermansiaceae bacterium]MDP4781008.1 hypothetical protein [Akkermansiaceae bacterium]
MKSPLHSYICLLVTLLAIFSAGKTFGQEDPGRTKIGKLEVTVYFATNGDPAAAGERAAEISEETSARFQSEEQLKFTHYRALGADTQPIFRSYENWAQPLKPSDEILVRFENRNQPNDDEISLDLELWLARKKILKTDALLRPGIPLFVLGPEWRGGRLIIATALAK